MDVARQEVFLNVDELRIRVQVEVRATTSKPGTTAKALALCKQIEIAMKDLR